MFKKKFDLHKRTLCLMLIDMALLVISALLSYVIMNSQESITLSLRRLVPDIALFTVCAAAAMHLFGIYTTIWRYSGTREIFKCCTAIAAGTAVFWVTAEIANIYVSHIYNFMTFLVAEGLVCASRIEYRLFYARRAASSYPAENANRVKTLIVGGGDSCRRVLTEMNDPTCEYEAVAIVDDDPAKLYRKIGAVKIVGTIDDLPKFAKALDIDLIIVAIPSCDKEQKTRILNICSQARCEVKVLPYIHQLIMNKSLLGQIEDVKPEELLGRDVITFDDDKNRRLISGRVCMVTGGGGSIGSELSRQIARHSPKRLIIVDIYENNAYDIQQELKIKYGGSLNLEVRIASVRDYDKMDELMREFRPELVFHAAAHKHVPLMEDSPEEAVKNNIIGTYNAALLADKYGAEKFVLVSTDKAVNPTNVMGATKRCCEMIIEYMAQKSASTEFVAVRFGNVLGSNGSVIPLFKKQIQNGGPVTVTHRDIIRYFMTIPEAVSLILQAASFAHGGEIFVLDMGEPVKIVTLAENLIKLMGKEPYVDIDIEFTGLRPGEKLYEELLMSEEGLSQTENHKIYIGRPINVNANEFLRNIEKIRAAAATNDSAYVVECLHEIVPTFKRPSAEPQSPVKGRLRKPEFSRVTPAA